jgi:WD40-like Beta Propeller Repeat/Dipeptidyl peptidase IV (DPP IV) N-terminal region
VQSRNRGLAWRSVRSVGVKCRLLVGFGLAVGAVLMLAGPASATVSGTNGPIAFVRSVTCSTNTNDSGYQIYKINPDGSGFTNLSQSVCSGFSDQNPKWSPDGSKIAFVRCCSDGVNQVYVMNSDGSNPTQLGNGLFNDSGAVAWSPTGNRIAFIRSGSVWTMNSDGSSPTQVPNTGNVYPYYGIAWSPDGTRVAFSGYEPNYGEYDVYTVAPTGSNLSDLTYGSGYSSYGASDWTPSGSQILTWRYSCGYADVWTVNANGSGATDLTCGDTNYKEFPTSSPDGVKIAYDDGSTVYTMNSNGSSESALVSGSQPSWGSPFVTPKSPGAVSSLTGNYNSTSQLVSLSWVNPGATSTTDAPTGDVVRRGNVNSTCPSSSTSGASIGGTGLRTSESDSVSGLTSGTYCYAVFATNSAGAGTGATKQVTIGGGPPPGTLSAQFIVPSTMSTAISPTDPYSLFWGQGSCASGATYTLQESVNGGASNTVFTGTALKVTVSILPGNLYTFSVSCGGASSSTTFRLNGFQEGSASYTGTWTSTSFSGAWGGTAKYATASGASATFTCTCEAFTWVTDEDSTHGSAKVYVDGVLRATVNTQASTKKNRVVVFKYGWTTDGFHTMKIVNLATAGHPRVNVDGFLTRTSS